MESPFQRLPLLGGGSAEPPTPAPTLRQGCAGPAHSRGLAPWNFTGAATRSHARARENNGAPFPGRTLGTVAVRRQAPKFLFSAPMLALVGIAEPAAAGDSKLVGGSVCRRVGPGTAEVASANFGGILDGLQNATLAKQTVACPLVRDSGDEPFTDMYVRILDTIVAGGSTIVPRCRVNGLSADGDTLTSSAWVTHGNPSSGGLYEFDGISVVDEFDVELNGSAVSCAS